LKEFRSTIRFTADAIRRAFSCGRSVFQSTADSIRRLQTIKEFPVKEFSRKGIGVF
jgi:hypothetical protein